MAQASFYTYADTHARLMDWTGGADSTRTSNLARRAILDAYRDLPMVRNWNYYYGRGRIVTDDDYSTGTITYDHTGSTYERELTLATGTWPTNAAKGVVQIDGVEYQVDRRISSSIVTLKSETNPGADVAAGTSYQWYRDTYTLPRDYRTCDMLMCLDQSFTMVNGPPGAVLEGRRLNTSPGQPTFYGIVSDPDTPGAMAVFFDPPPDDQYNIDFIYLRIPYPFRTFDYSTGTVTCSASATVTGSGTAWTSDMAGSVFRVTSGTETPSGIDGSNPYTEEGIVLSVASATSLTLTAALTGTYSGKKYRLSDLVDVENGAMMSAFLRCCEKNLAWEMHREDAGLKQAAYEAALARAKDADSRSITRSRWPAVRTLGDMPSASDRGT